MTETSFDVRTPAGTIAGAQSGHGPALLLLHGGPGLSDYMDLLGPEVTGCVARALARVRELAGDLDGFAA